MKEIWVFIFTANMVTFLIWVAVGSSWSAGLLFKRAWERVNNSHQATQNEVSITLDSSAKDKVNLILNGGNVTFKSSGKESNRKENL